MKLPNGFGSVYKLSGKRRNPWVARKTTGFTFDEEKGKSYPTYEFIGSYPTRQEALTALVEYNNDPYDLHAETITFAEVYDRWSDIHFEKVSHSNIQGYKASYKLCDKIKNMTFRDIKLDHLQMVVDESGKNTPTLKKLKSMFGLMYDYAVMHEIVKQDKRDMVSYVDITKAGNPNALTRKPFTKKQISVLWDNQKDNEYISVILIMIYTGVRISELLELKKENVHLDERYFYIGKAKTEAGVREVPVAEKIVPLLEYWINKKCDYLICNNNSGKFSYKNFVDSYWEPIMQDLKFDHLPHDTRHTCVSMLTTAGVDERVIKQIVGHKGIGVTQAVYTHLELPHKLEAINKI